MKLSTLSTLIIDDEPLARKRIENLLQRVPEITVEGTYGTGKEAIKAIDELRPDMIFLDIQLKDITGFQVLEALSNEPPLVVFVTAFDSFAIKAFEVFAFDYLLKPYTEERFYKSVQNLIGSFEKAPKQHLEQTIHQLLGHVHTSSMKGSPKTRNRIPIPDKRKTLFVETADILYLKASNYYVEIFTKTSKYLLRESMHRMMERLGSNSFARIHRSSIVNLDHIIELISSDYGEVDVKMNNGELLRVSKGYRKGFLRKVGIRK